MVSEFFSKKYYFDRTKNFQFNEDFQNLVSSVVYDVNQVKRGSALQKKQSLGGLINPSLFPGD